VAQNSKNIFFQETVVAIEQPQHHITLSHTVSGCGSQDRQNIFRAILI